MSHYWGQYSPWFSVSSDIDPAVPDGCNITFAQLLARHGARNPTSSKTRIYAALVEKLHADVKQYSENYTFLENYSYRLGANSLTTFGQQQMIYAGVGFYNRYRDLSSAQVPFIRAASSQRVVESALNFSQGFHVAGLKEGKRDDGYPYDMVVIEEDMIANNTLNNDLCDNFSSHIASHARKTWARIFVPPIQGRVNSELLGAHFTLDETIYLMDLCPFETVQSPSGRISPFCNLFTIDEWHAYNYYRSLEKYYGFANGNPLGPTRGVGFTNELIARMTNKPVVDNTSVNHTLDSSNDTFPIATGQALFADFTHDNDMLTIFGAMGLYNDTPPLSNMTMQSSNETRGFSSAWTVPFGARAYFEKMTCPGYEQELVRVLVNDRVLPLHTCGGDSLGRCTLDAWVESLEFARGNGRWADCFS